MMCGMCANAERERGESGSGSRKLDTGSRKGGVWCGVAMGTAGSVCLCE